MNIFEAAVAASIVAVAGVATLGTAIDGAAAAHANTVRDALEARARSEMRVALDVLKYDGAVLTPNAVATSVPLPGGTALPVTLALQTAAQAGGAIEVTVTASAATGERASVSGTLASRAPLPGSTQRVPGLVPAPTGAP